MKNKSKVIILITTLVILISALVLYFVFGKNSDSKVLEGSFDFSTEKIENVKLNTGLVIEKGTIEKVDDHYRIHLVTKNNTKNTVDMSIYRVAFLDENGEEIEFFRGTIIGTLKPGESSESIIESYQDLSKLKTISYKEFPYEN